MDDKLRASFIPKQPLVGHEVVKTRRRQSSGGGLSPLFYMSITIMFLALLSWGGVFVWKLLVQKSIDEKMEEVNAVYKDLNPADVARYKRLDDRIRVASERLQSHTVVSPLFDLLNKITLPEVQYTSMTYEVEERQAVMPEWYDPSVGAEPIIPAGTDYKLSIEAAADSFETIALQSRIFQNEEMITSATFANFKIDEATRVITFDIEAVINPKLVSYADVVTRSGQIEIEEVVGEGVVDEGEGFEPADDEPAVVEESTEPAETTEEVLPEVPNTNE